MHALQAADVRVPRPVPRFRSLTSGCDRQRLEPSVWPPFQDGCPGARSQPLVPLGGRRVIAAARQSSSSLHLNGYTMELHCNGHQRQMKWRICLWALLVGKNLPKDPQTPRKPGSLP